MKPIFSALGISVFRSSEIEKEFWALKQGVSEIQIKLDNALSQQSGGDSNVINEQMEAPYPTPLSVNEERIEHLLRQRKRAKSIINTLIALLELNNIEVNKSIINELNNSLNE